MHVKKGDNIIVLSGKDKGKKSKVLRVLPKENRVLVEGVNIFKKHMKARGEGRPGQMIEVSRPIHLSNVLPVDKKTGKGTRVGTKKVGDKKVRIAQKSGQEI
jgi:large subunit ribosomal protein L24